MRERKRFAERTRVLVSDEVRQKYFLVYEGENTELVYFDAITELREDLKLNPLIELVPIVRSYNEEGWSNPKKKEQTPSPAFHFLQAVKFNNLSCPLQYKGFSMLSFFPCF